MRHASKTKRQGPAPGWKPPWHFSAEPMLVEDVATALRLLEEAAVALRLDAEVQTSDLDFGRFPKVRFINPLR